MRFRIPVFFAALVLVFGCKKTDETPEEQPLTPTVGAINARFSVSDDCTVVFAKGNLQYNPSRKAWRLAANQYDAVGLSNALMDSAYNGWTDLFGWGTSGFNGKMPYMVVDTGEYYGFGLNNISYTQYDWGQYVHLSDEGITNYVWRTLSFAEWEYLLKSRDAASVKKGLAEIRTKNGTVCGMVLLPDHWKLPPDCSFQYGTGSGFRTNSYTLDQWGRMQDSGAVFLPAAGYRDSLTVSLVGDYGCYWTGTYCTDNTAYDFSFSEKQYGLTTSSRSNGQSVRLVQTR